MLPFKDMNSIPYEAEYAPYKAESGGSEIFEYAKLLQGQFGLNLQMITKLNFIRYVHTKYFKGGWGR